MNQPEMTRRKMHITTSRAFPPDFIYHCSVCGASKDTRADRKLGLNRWILDGQPMSYCPGKEEMRATTKPSAIRFKPDGPLRRKWFVPEAIAFPAKAHLGMMLKIFEQHTQEADWILDPFGGIGGSLVGCLTGRNVIIVEKEARWVRAITGYECDGLVLGYEEQVIEEELEGGYVRAEFGGDVHLFQTEQEALDFYRARQTSHGDIRGEPAYRSYTPASTKSVALPSVCGRRGEHKSHHVQGSWEKMQVVGPMLGYSMGEARIWQGDSRHLPPPLDSVATVITSPPYEGSMAPGKDGIDWSQAKDSDRSEDRSRRDDGSASYRGYVDKIITSPPYGEAQSGGGISIKGHYDDPGLAKRVYSDRAMGGIDAIISSPPYENSAHKPGNIDAMREKMEELYPGHIGPNSLRNGTEYSLDSANIGNLKGPEFWEAVTAVFQECQRVLKPGGNFVIISKGCTRDGQYVDLPGQFRATMEALGFELQDHWQRGLWQRSFWRTLQKNKRPESWDENLDYESVMTFRK
mgnify:CR=1 FL=1